MFEAMTAFGLAIMAYACHERHDAERAWILLMVAVFMLILSLLGLSVEARYAEEIGGYLE